MSEEQIQAAQQKLREEVAAPIACASRQRGASRGTQFQERENPGGEMGLFSDETTEALRTLGSKIFVVAGQAALADGGVLQKTYSFLRYHGFQVRIFDGVAPGPHEGIIDRGAAKLSSSGSDLILALGGGSVIDAAKAINVSAARGRSLFDRAGIQPS
ncbi:MAG: iron-containing alcohol dehydrogenase, partial [Myxococcales bacterium]|nr:iron-containing alcohol dehydrogenase [Myxococcales bacterium]